MTFAWQDYLFHAQALVAGAASSKTAEADYRSAVSRAYYAAYHAAVAYLRHQDKKQVLGRLTHHGVIVLLSSDSVTTGIGTKLERLRDKRELADYRPYSNKQSPKGEADVAIQWAHELLQEIAALY